MIILTIHKTAITTNKTKRFNMKILNYFLVLISTIYSATPASAATFEIKPQIFNGTGADAFCDALRQEIKTSALAAAKAEAKTLTETQITNLLESNFTSVHIGIRAAERTI